MFVEFKIRRKYCHFAAWKITCSKISTFEYYNSIRVFRHHNMLLPRILKQLATHWFSFSVTAVMQYTTIQNMYNNILSVSNALKLEFRRSHDQIGVVICKYVIFLWPTHVILNCLALKIYTICLGECTSSNIQWTDCKS